MKINKDLYAFSNGSKKKMLTTIIVNPCFHSVCLYRFSNLLYKVHLSILAKFIWYINRLLFHVDIDYRANFEGGFVIKHGLGLVVGKNVKTYGKVTLYQGVTLGGCGCKREYGGIIIDQPILKDNVTVYTDAKVFGPVIIGCNNSIKAGMIVTKDLPDYRRENE